jgi:hypothetical protein
MFQRNEIRATRVSPELVIVSGDDGVAQREIRCVKVRENRWEVREGVVILDSAGTEQGATNIAFFALWS